MFNFNSNDSESEFNDFNDTPTYIRKGVKSCSNFNFTDTYCDAHFDNIILNNESIKSLSSDNRRFEKLSEHLLSEDKSYSESPHESTDVSESQKPDSNQYERTDNDLNSVLISVNLNEEWNAEDDTFSARTDNAVGSFTSRIYSSPKTFSASFTKFINNLFENPEGRMTNSQRVTILLYTLFEAYRTIISSFLTVFVPQNCGGYSCTILQNTIPKDNIEIIAISVNTFMAFYFCTLFTIESFRETLIKEYLIFDKSFSTDKEYLIQMISEMKPNEQRKILKLNRIYRGFAQFLLLLFFVNAGISCVVIQRNYLNNTTFIVFVTNTFFMINRIHKAIKITSSGEYNIYSAYRSNNLIYNRYRGKITHTNV